jgi:hypothetical protein
LQDPSKDPKPRIDEQPLACRLSILIPLQRDGPATHSSNNAYHCSMSTVASFDGSDIREEYPDILYSLKRSQTQRSLVAHSRMQPPPPPSNTASPPIATGLNSSSNAAPILDSRQAIPLAHRHIPVDPSSSTSISSTSPSPSQDVSTDASTSTISVSGDGSLQIVPCAPSDIQKLKYHRTVY